MRRRSSAPPSTPDIALAEMKLRSPDSVDCSSATAAPRTTITPMTSEDSNYAALTAAVAHPGGGPSAMHLAVAFVIDTLLWAAVFLRPYQRGLMCYHCTVSHFVMVLPMGDVALLFVPSRFRHWMDLFRLVGALQVGALTLQLWMAGIDGGGGGPLAVLPPVAVTLLRLVLCAARGLHALWGLWLHFDVPEDDESVVVVLGRRRSSRVATFVRHHVLALARFCVAGRLPPAELSTALVFVMFAATVRSTHNVFGEVRAEGPLTSFQAADAFGFFLRNMAYDRLIGAGATAPSDAARCWRVRAGVQAFMAAVLLLQWPFMFAMFSEAPLPFAHIFAEVGLLRAAYARLKRAQRCERELGQGA